MLMRLAKTYSIDVKKRFLRFFYSCHVFTFLTFLKYFFKVFFKNFYIKRSLKFKNFARKHPKTF